MSLLGVKGFLSTKNVSDYFTQVSKLLETFSANVVIDFFFNLSWQPKQLKQEALLCVVFWGRNFFSPYLSSLTSMVGYWGSLTNS